jgi:hypothetical protein
MKPLFRHYWWIALIAAIAGGLSIYRLASLQDRAALVAALAAAIVSFCYFVQQQKLEEIRLFKELFEEFNSRYDKLNGDLSDISTGIQPSDAAARKKLIDYFNLCGEEYLFYEEGYIHPVVWQSWCRGILSYLKAPHIRTLWDEEVEQGRNTYYGLTVEKLREGAEL